MRGSTGRLSWSVLTEELSTTRTCRLRNAIEERLRGLTTENLSALDRVLSFLEKHRIHLYRISSNLTPFASHPINTIRWVGRVRPHLHPAWRQHAQARHPSIHSSRAVHRAHQVSTPVVFD